MKQERLKLYTIDLKYVRNLANVDRNVMSTSPQVGKSTRPFVGIIIICEDKQYCVPLSSPKQKHYSMKNDSDFTKILDGDKLLGVLNFNCMIPVNEQVIRKIDMKISASDNANTISYKKLMAKQISFCQKNQDAIVRKANKLYELIVCNKTSVKLKKRCCDFRRLETVLEKYLSKGNR